MRARNRAISSRHTYIHTHSSSSSSSSSLLPPPHAGHTTDDTIHSPQTRVLSAFGITAGSACRGGLVRSRAHTCSQPGPLTEWTVRALPDPSRPVTRRTPTRYGWLAGWLARCRQEVVVHSGWRSTLLAISRGTPFPFPPPPRSDQIGDSSDRRTDGSWRQVLRLPGE